MKSTFGFEILSQDTARARFSTKTVGVRRVRCPRCGDTFKQAGHGGCFVVLWTPISCECGFPWPEKKNPSSLGSAKK